MKAGHIIAPRQLEIVEVPPPDMDLFDGTPVMIKMHAGVLCGSDFPRFTGGMFDVTFPRPVGDSLHEIIGEVVESRSPRFKPGDRVLAIPPDHRGLSELFLADAGMVIPLPDYEPIENLILSQPLGTVIWAVRKLPSIIHQNIVVIGQGPIGQLFDHTLAGLGARRVIGVDKLNYRLEFASKHMRATHSFNPDQDDVRQAVLDLTDGQGADVVIEAVGHSEDTVRMAIDLCRREGTVILFGLPTHREQRLPIWDLLFKNVRLIGSIHPEAQRDWPLAMDMITQGRIDVAPLITHRFPLERVADAYCMAIDKPEPALKVLVEAGQY